MIVSDGSKGAVGLVLRRSVRTLGIEAFYTQFMGGVEEVLVSNERPFILQVVPDMASELDAYRRWAEGGRVEGVILVDILSIDDPRLELMEELGMSCLMLTPDPDPRRHAAVVTDELTPMHEVVRHLASLGHEVIGRVSGPSALVHTLRRSEAFAAACESSGVEGVVVGGDYTEEGGRSAVARLLDGSPRPSAVVFDNDVMAVAALDTITARGLSVPGDVSVLAWDDSVACRLASPAVSALRRDVHHLGTQVANALVELMELGRPSINEAETPRLVTRASTAAPRD